VALPHAPDQAIALEFVDSRDLDTLRRCAGQGHGLSEIDGSRSPLAEGQRTWRGVFRSGPQPAVVIPLGDQFLVQLLYLLAAEAMVVQADVEGDPSAL
jgi:hypothetical protein